MSQDVLFFDAIKTPIGDMLALANKEKLLCLAFEDSKGVDKMFGSYLGREWVQANRQANHVIKGLVEELNAYFAGQLHVFTTPWQAKGTAFQRQAWEALAGIPFGETRSYANQAKAMGKPKAFRAVALANAANWFTILLPCHRVIASTGGLSGYGGGVERKKWLLAHEQAHR